jgi:hypothetical protein
VVNEKPVGDTQDFAVHPDELFAGAGEVTNGVEGGGARVGVPFEAGQSRIIFGVNDGEFAASERDFAKGIAETESAVDEDEEYERAFDEFRNMYFYCDVDGAIPKFRRQTTDSRNPRQFIKRSPLPQAAGLIPPRQAHSTALPSTKLGTGRAGLGAKYTPNIKLGAFGYYPALTLRALTPRINLGAFGYYPTLTLRALTPRINLGAKLPIVEGLGKNSPSTIGSTCAFGRKIGDFFGVGKR